MKILVVALDNLGDAVMAAAVLKPIRRLHPGATVGLWVKRYAAGLFSDQSLLDRVHASDPFWDKAPGQKKGSWGDFLVALWEIRTQHYDLVYILNTEWRRSLACWVAGISSRVGYNRRHSRIFLTRALPFTLEGNPGPVRHFIDDHRMLLEAESGQTVSEQECIPRLDLTHEENDFWNLWSKKTGWRERGFLTIHPFSGDEDKNWPWSCWIELLQRLYTDDPSLCFLILCGPGEESKLDSVGSHLPADCFQVLAAAPLPQVKTLLAKAVLALGGDSGPGHIAAALGTPVLSLFGDSNPDRCRPLGRSLHRVIKHSPLRRLPVSDVFAEVQAFLSALSSVVKV